MAKIKDTEAFAKILRLYFLNEIFSRWFVENRKGGAGNKRSELSHIKCNIDKCFRVEKTNQQGIYYTFDTSNKVVRWILCA